MKHEHISISFLMRNLPKLTEIVEVKLSQLLPRKIALVFDGWTHGSTHYLAVFASFPTDNSVGFDTRLLTVSPMNDESKLDEDEYIEFMSYVLGLYQKSLENVICMIGDIVSVNSSISTKTGVPLVGSASHRFNLVVQDVLSCDMELLTKVNLLMVKLRTLRLSARLRRLTSLRPMLRNTTRWISTFNMMARYVELRGFLPQFDSMEVDEMSLSPQENRRVDTIMERLKDFESVTKALQKDDTSLSEVRAIFDEVIDKLPETDCRLSSTANIVHCVWFESAIVKIQRGNSNALSREEQFFVSSFEVDGVCDIDEEPEGISFVERALKRQRTHMLGSTKKYIDTRFVLATSNVCERLFSRIGHVFTDRRNRLTPANLEAQIFFEQ